MLSAKDPGRGTCPTEGSAGWKPPYDSNYWQVGNLPYGGFGGLETRPTEGGWQVGNLPYGGFGGLETRPTILTVGLILQQGCVEGLAQGAGFDYLDAIRPGLATAQAAGHNGCPEA